MPNDCFYDYANKCDCSEDDKCGCDFPNNMAHDFSCNQTFIYPPQTKKFSRAIVSNSAPDFTAPAVLTDNTLVPDFNLYQYLDNAYGLLIFYPADFTYICPTELWAYHKEMSAFQKRNVMLLGISTDSDQSHLAWRNRSLSQGGIGALSFPLISDFKREISAAYGILSTEGLAMRASFLIDKSKIVRYQSINDEKIGRNPAETLRIIDALQFSESNGTLCPAGWHKGNMGLKRNFEDVARVLQNI